MERLTSGWVFNISVKKHCQDLVGGEFKHLFQRFLEHEYLVLGLYRKRNSINLRYLITCPSPNIVVHEDDCLLLLDKHATVLRENDISAQESQ